VKIDREQILRRITFRPYSDKRAPAFRLVVWDTYRHHHGKPTLGYRLAYLGGATIFQGEDFCCSPMYSIDGRATICTIMGFLCLRPRDTDAGYFDDYTPEQHAFAEEHAEAISACVEARFGPR
jgi:hypothetical protein